jgi:hypothetical protein
MLNHEILLQALKTDLVNQYGLPTDVVVGLTRYFHTDHPDYVKRVSAWQEFLVAGNGELDRVLAALLLRARAVVPYGGGYVLSDKVDSIAAVHQVAMFFWKEEYDMTATADWQAYAERLEASGRLRNLELAGKLRRYLARLLPEAPAWDELVGAMGTGSTADRRNLVERWFVTNRPLDIPSSFFRYNAHDDRPFVSVDPVGVARAATVPKNRKGPRFVASEPSPRMFAQKAIMQALDKVIARKLGKRAPIWDAELHRRFLVKHFRNAVTIDLSDASDYISMELVDAIFPADWRDLFFSSRSQLVSLPSGDLIRPNTCAPMGNGYCFRLLTLVCSAVLAVVCRHPWSDFGDDMICLQPDAPMVMWALGELGLKLNYVKTGTSRYLETCGLELFDGYDITPFKPKRVLEYKGKMADIGAALRATSRHLPEVGKALLAGLGQVQVRFRRRYQRLEYLIPSWVERSEACDVTGWSGMFRHAVVKPREGRPLPWEVHTIPGLRWAAATDPLLIGTEFNGAGIVLPEG